jgi:hypothetical protein
LDQFPIVGTAVANRYQVCPSQDGQIFSR